MHTPHVLVNSVRYQLIANETECKKCFVWLTLASQPEPLDSETIENKSITFLKCAKFTGRDTIYTIDLYDCDTGLYTSFTLEDSAFEVARELGRWDSRLEPNSGVDIVVRKLDDGFELLFQRSYEINPHGILGVHQGFSIIYSKLLENLSLNNKNSKPRARPKASDRFRRFSV